MEPFLIILAVILGTAWVVTTAICAVKVLVKLFRYEGMFKGIIGIFIGPYTFIWGWINAKRLGLRKVMIVWSVMLLLWFGLMPIISFALYQQRKSRHEHQVAAAVELENKEKAQVEVFVDDATVNGETRLLGGTIHNISSEPLHNIAIELQLRRRVGGGIETRAITPEHTELAPDGTTRYSLELRVQDYISVTVLRIVAGDNRAQVPFKVLPGAARRR